MTLNEIYAILSTISGFTGKVVYSAWPQGEAPSLPFICYLAVRSRNFAADGKVYYPRQVVHVELYTMEKEPATEALVEAALTGAGIFWEKSEEYLTEQRCYEILYEMEV